jgi:fumarate reductase subunit C
MTAGQGVQYIEPIKLLGTTWYRRGPGYWARRISLSFVYLLLAAGGGALTYLLVRTIWVDPTAPTVVKIVLTVIAAAATVWTAVITVRAYRRAEQTSVRNRRTRQRGILGALQTLGFVIVAVVCCVFIAFGGLAATFGYSLRRDFFGEHQARLKQQNREAHRGNPPPQHQRKRR